MPTRGWVIFKNWMKDCILYSHLPENHTKNGELKFPRYIALCSCGDMDCNNRRNPTQSGFGGASNLNSSINYHHHSEHSRSYWEKDDEEDFTHAVYVNEDDVILQKGGRIPRYMTQDEIKHAIKLLKRNLHSW